MPQSARSNRGSQITALRCAAALTALGCVLLGCAHNAPEEGAPSPSSDEGISATQEVGDDSYPGEAAEGRSNDSSASTDDAEPADEAEAAAPERVQIPSIGLDEGALIDLGIQPDGRLEVPAQWDDVGWFAEGSMPGTPGPTVIAAHVDSRSGPAVFYHLPEVVKGDEVTVIDVHGREHLYEVESTADFPKDDFPTREVFGAGLEDELRLITCTGEFDDAAGRHLDNRVVFASRAH